MAAGPADTSTRLDREVVHGTTGARLDALAARYSEWGFAGTVLIAHGDEVLLHKGYGLADREAGAANTVATRHPSLSITKPILAMAVMRLAERGLVDLDEPLSTYLGPFPESKQTATLHHLLTHTAGLAERGSDVARPVRAEFVQAMKEAPFESPPGLKRRYSNAGYSLIAALVEQVTGKPWETTIREEVFGPAGMADSTFATDPEAPPIAIGYAGTVYASRPMTLADGPQQMAELWWGAAGAAGVDGTVADLYRWLRAATTGGLVNAASSERIFTAHIEDQGYGWHVDTTADGVPRRWKGGGLPMYESKVAWYPEQDFVIAFAINNHFGWRVPLWNGLEKILFGGEIDRPPRPVPGATPDMAGSYRLGDGSLVTLETKAPWVLVTAEDETAAENLGFEGRAIKAGATLATKVVAAGTLVGVHPRPGSANLTWMEMEAVETSSGDSGLPLLEVRSKPKAGEH